MPEYDNTNSGMIMRNERRTTDKHPEFTGSLNVEGVDYWVSAWVRESRAGKKYFSLSLKPKEQANNVRQLRAGQQPSKQPAPRQPDFDDEIPF